MPKQKSDKRSRDERREEALRPCDTLGYDRDSLALHFLEKEMFALAEAQLRRAIWLNPFEPVFKVHLGWCLYRQDKFAEAQEWARKALDLKEDSNTRDLLNLIERALDEENGQHAQGAQESGS